jgi:hypothetical protein
MISLAPTLSMEFDSIRLLVTDGVGFTPRIGAPLQHTAPRMSDDHAVKAGPFKPVVPESVVAVCPALPPPDDQAQLWIENPAG